MPEVTTLPRASGWSVYPDLGTPLEYDYNGGYSRAERARLQSEGRILFRTVKPDAAFDDEDLADFDDTEEAAPELHDRMMRARWGPLRCGYYELLGEWGAFPPAPYWPSASDGSAADRAWRCLTAHIDACVHCNWPDLCPLGERLEAVARYVDPVRAAEENEGERSSDA